MRWQCLGDLLRAGIDRLDDGPSRGVFRIQSF